MGNKKNNTDNAWKKKGGKNMEFNFITKSKKTPASISGEMNWTYSSKEGIPTLL